MFRTTSPYEGATVEESRLQTINRLNNRIQKRFVEQEFYSDYGVPISWVLVVANSYIGPADYLPIADHPHCSISISDVFQFIGDSIMKPSQLYLFAYNVVQVLGWGFILLRTICGLSEGLSWPELYSTVEVPVKIFQTAAVLEVLHSLFGIVRSPFGTTLMQVTSRVTLVWPILHLCNTASGSLGVPMLLVAWSVTEVIRYSFYALGLFSAVPYFLTYLRYTTFIVLYPLGVTGELLTLFSALPEVHERKIWTLEMPNALNMGISFWWILIFAALSYIPGFPQLYFYMFAQRKKIIGGVDSSSSKNKKKA